MATSFPLPLLYIWSTHVFIAIYLIIHSSMHLFVHDAVGVENTKQTSKLPHLCHLDLPLVSCCYTLPVLLYVCESMSFYDESQYFQNSYLFLSLHSLFLQMSFLSFQTSSNCAIAVIASSRIALTSVLADHCTKVYKLFHCLLLLIIDYN